MSVRLQFKDHFVAFLDVMGFTALVNGSYTTRLQEYFNQVTNVLEELRTDKQNIESIILSDSIILIGHNSESGLRDLMFAIRKLQYKLILKKILLRGALSHGQVFYNNELNILVGQGYIRAYLLEQKANFPRVIIDPKIVTIFNHDRQEFVNAINKSDRLNIHERLIYVPTSFSNLSDDAIFIDYANRIIRDDKVQPSINIVYDIIRENLYREQELFQKYIWLKNYFLEFIQYTQSIASDDEFSDRFRGKLESLFAKFKSL